MSVTEHVLGPSIEKVREAHKSIGHAIGALEMAERQDDRELLAGYSGSAAIRYLREAQKQAQKALDILSALGPR